MNKAYIALAVMFGLLVGATGVAANVDRTEVHNTRSGKSVMIPAHAEQISANVFSLGSSVDAQTGDMVEGYLITHPRKAYGKPDGTPGNGGGNGGGKGNDKDDDSGDSNTSPSCYTYIAKGAAWTTVEPWVVNPANPDGMTDASVFSILSNGIDKWEDAADGSVGDGAGVDILGDGTITTAALEMDTESTDGQNEVYFDALDSGTIGVTIVWGVFSGPPSGRYLAEWDQVYNTLYAWSDTGAAEKMDFDNIATHELGHSVGLGDLYESGCSDETMYGYGAEGETKKRSLEAGDIAGVSKLY